LKGAWECSCSLQERLLSQMLRLEAILDCASFHQNGLRLHAIKGARLFWPAPLTPPRPHRIRRSLPYSVPTYLNAFKQGMPCPPFLMVAHGPWGGHACAFNGRDSRIRRGPRPMPFPKSKSKSKSNQSHPSILSAPPAVLYSLYRNST
jgi:hypothetical protein